MNWPNYPTYRPSGLPWIGDIPTHWSIAPNRSVLELRRDLVGTKSSEYRLLSLTLRGVIVRDISENKGKFPAEFDTYQVVDPGNLVFCLFDIEETPRTVGLAKDRGMVTGAYDVFRVRNQAHGRYFEYLYRALDDKKSLSYFYSGMRKVIRMPTFKSIRCPVPPLSEQRIIADFLDFETAKIDALIGKQRQLVATLREDRAATIAHAVTKGLDRNAELIDSQIDAVGTVPIHWRLTQFRHLVERIEQGVSPQAYAELADDGWGVLKSGCVNGGIFSDIQHKKLPNDFEFDPTIVVKIGDLLVCRASGSTELVGSAALVRQLRYQVILSDKTFRVVPREVATADYLEWLMNSRMYREQVRGAISGAEGLANNLPMSELKTFRFPIPPLTEQRAISIHLDERCRKIDALISTAGKVIERLSEYRSAIITNAVTGKIDVREAV